MDEKSQLLAEFEAAKAQRDSVSLELQKAMAYIESRGSQFNTQEVEDDEESFDSVSFSDNDSFDSVNNSTIIEETDSGENFDDIGLF